VSGALPVVSARPGGGLWITASSAMRGVTWRTPAAARHQSDRPRQRDSDAQAIATS
jgi:hypothetical protein